MNRPINPINAAYLQARMRLQRGVPPYKGLDHNTVTAQPGFLDALIALKDLGIPRDMRVVITYGAPKVLLVLKQIEPFRLQMDPQEYAAWVVKLIADNPADN